MINRRCIRFPFNKCKKGDKCDFIHSIDKPVECIRCITYSAYNSENTTIAVRIFTYDYINFIECNDNCKLSTKSCMERWDYDMSRTMINHHAYYESIKKIKFYIYNCLKFINIVPLEIIFTIINFIPDYCDRYDKYVCTSGN